MTASDPDRTDRDSADDADGWRFGVDDVGEEATAQPRVRDPIEPESPSAENALFVIVGAAGTLLLFATALLPV